MPYLFGHLSFGHLSSLFLWASLVSPALARVEGGVVSPVIADGASSPPGVVQTLALGDGDRVLGVVHDHATTPELSALRDRLGVTGIPYQTLALQSLDNLEDLSDYTILFLTNLETLSLRQVVVLEQWYNRGGRLIVSGPLGTRSSGDVQQMLRNLMGAYWDEGFPAGTNPSPRVLTSWAPRLGASDLQAGVVVPIRLDSAPVAVWQGERTQGAAVVANGRSVFLGWNWGETGATAAEFDRRWLQASLQYFGTFSLARSGLGTSTTAGAGFTTAQRLPNPDPLPPLRPGAGDRPSRSDPPAQSSPPRSVTPGPVTPGPATPRSTTPPAPNPSRPGADITVEPDPETDPSQQVAQPGLDVGLTGEPIVFLEAVAMRQELNNLLGRFQNGHLALRLAQAQGSAGACLPGGGGCPSPGSAPLASTALKAMDVAQVAVAFNPSVNRLLTTVQATLRSFPQDVAARNYDEARRQWLAARRQLWDSYPQSQPLQPEVRAVWLDRGTLVEAGSPQGLAQIFDQLQASGINVVFLETINAGYTIYPSRVAAEQNPLIRGWDPLEVGVKLAHERGMELHAWMWTFAVGNMAHNRLLGLPPTDMGPVLRHHPDWVNIDNYGRRIQPNSGKMFLDPANPAARNYLLSLIDEISDRYDVDGVQLDYIRYPFQDMAGGFTFGYGSAARQQFKAQTGVDPVTLQSRSPLWGQWLEFRKTQITEFVASAADLLRRQHPDVALSVAVFPFPTHERNAKIQQDWETWAKAGDVDMVVLMSYALDTNRFQDLTQPWLQDPELQSTLIIPGIHLPHLGEVETLDQVQFLRDNASAGYALFAMDHLEETLRSQFHPTVTSAMDQTLPHRDPFGAAALRFGALTQEWDFLYGQGELSVRPTSLDTWQGQRQALARALDALAQDPSAARLQAARTALTSFEANLNDWLYLHALEHPYPMQTWEHRLATVQVLLNYGERVVLQQQRDLKRDLLADRP